MVHIEHVAIWTHDLERLRAFYETYFGATAGDKYANPAHPFESYFLTFESGARLELMRMTGIPQSANDVERQFTGLIHISIAVGSVAEVDALTERLRANGYRVMDGPRHTGDGYYEAAVLDPDGNRVEVTV
jgi:lactoylglutathione lyase